MTKTTSHYYSGPQKK